MTHRTRLFSSLWTSFLFLSAASVAFAAETSDDKLRALYNAEWEWREKEFARQPGEAGRGYTADYLPRVDAAAQKARLAYWTSVLKQLDAIDVATLSAPERLNGEIFRALIEENATDTRFKTYEAPFNADTFFWTSFTPREGFVTADEYRRYLGRLRDVPRQSRWRQSGDGRPLRSHRRGNRGRLRPHLPVGAGR